MRHIKLYKTPKKIDLDFINAIKGKIEVLSQKYGVSLFYLFGSLAKNNLKSLSDIDIAVESEKGTAFDLDMLLALTSDIQDLFGREDIDIVDLRKASPLLKMCILKEGKLLYRKDESDLVKFRYNTLNLYLSTAYLRSSFFNYVREAVLGMK